jgi:hypothetical protein
MARRSGTSPKLDVNGLTVPAQRQGAPEGMAGTTWWKVSAVTAGKIMAALFPGKRPPRPGYEVRLPDSVRRGHRGYWTLSSRAGQYELMFYYR